MWAHLSSPTHQAGSKRFTEKEFKGIGRKLDEKEQFNDRLWEKAAELGFISISIDETYGRAGWASLSSASLLRNLPVWIQEWRM